MSNHILPKAQNNSQELKEKIEPIFTVEEVYKKASFNPEIPEHVAYLQKKGLCKEDIPSLKFGYYKYGLPSLVIPIKDLSGALKSVQYIYYNSEGDKQVNFLKGADKSEGFLSFDPLEDGKKIFVTEGVATGASLRKITQSSEEFKDSIVISAFTAADVPKVAKILKDRFEYGEVIAAPDADHAGNEAAKKCKAIGVYSIFPPQMDKGSDWNDIHLELGVKGALEAFETSITLKEISTLSESEVSSQTIPEIEKILEHLDEDPCKDLSMEHFPPVLKQYIESICETTEAHPIMIIMSVLCSISAMLGKKVYIPKGEYFQNLYPNIWSLCINKSGGFKSTALNKGSELALEDTPINGGHQKQRRP